MAALPTFGDHNVIGSDEPRKRAIQRPPIRREQNFCADRLTCIVYFHDIHVMFPDLGRLEGFQWDKGNIGKNADKHGVSDREAEQVFFNQPVLLEDPKHSARELRFHALGPTNQGRLLHVSFTFRDGGKLIRVISAPALNRKERVLYAEEAQTDPEVQERG